MQSSRTPAQIHGPSAPALGALTKRQVRKALVNLAYGECHQLDPNTRMPPEKVIELQRQAKHLPPNFDGQLEMGQFELIGDTRQKSKRQDGQDSQDFKLSN